MPDLTLADALRLAINVLRDTTESRRTPSREGLDQSTADLHAAAADTLEASLTELRGQE